jgi:hypothetical protein
LPGSTGAEGPRGPAGITLLAQSSPVYFLGTSSGFIEEAFSVPFVTTADGPVKVSWDDYRGGIFGTAASSACIYRLSIDGAFVGGHRRMNVYGSTLMVEDWGTITFFAPSVGAGSHIAQLSVQSQYGANCIAGANGPSTSVIVEGY